MNKYTFFEDPGHGWLAVSLHELSELGLVNKISGYSYVSRDRQTVYLEEDCDESRFLAAKLGPYDKETRNWNEWRDQNVDTVYHEDNRIRGLPAYRLMAPA